MASKDSRPLSTPHGALGTYCWALLLLPHPPKGAFNSTRCIRNLSTIFSKAKAAPLSTPHGALGTQGDRTTEAKQRRELSTPHGALGTSELDDRLNSFELLSTPHGALGTTNPRRRRSYEGSTFNSTRCIRNENI